jgi:hypothetical protein
MNVIQTVDSLNSQYGLSNVESAVFLTKDILLHQQSHEIATLQELHDQVEVLFILERAFQFDYPVILGQSEDISLGPHVCDLVLIDHFGLFHLLNGYDLRSFFVTADSHLSKSTSSDDFQGLKVSHCNFGS